MITMGRGVFRGPPLLAQIIMSDKCASRLLFARNKSMEKWPRAATRSCGIILTGDIHGSLNRSILINGSKQSADRSLCNRRSSARRTNHTLIIFFSQLMERINF
jgi:hypothetical protein